MNLFIGIFFNLKIKHKIVTDIKSNQIFDSTPFDDTTGYLTLHEKKFFDATIK